MQAVPSQGALLVMSAPARDPLDDILRKLAACIRLLMSDKIHEVEGAEKGIQRLLKSASDKHALAARIESNGGVDENYKREVRAQIERAKEIARAFGYAEGVKAAEERFRPSGKVTFSEVAMYVQSQIYRIPPDKHEFIRKMAIYARQEYEPTQKQGKFLFDLFVQYLGGRIT
jgi:hypothetical protein